MSEAYIVEAVRSPIGRRKGALSGLMPADLLGAVQKAAIERSGIEQAIDTCHTIRPLLPGAIVILSR